jgi:2-polyprenyl-6-methoxyphenol hydroxylase-like FAD-dependent oxidoreductase
MAGSQHVAVIGGSVAGLSAGLFLARRGHRVTLLEKDATPTPATAAEAGAWRRRATPQAAHSHAFLARTRELLATEAPDLLDELLTSGVREARLASVLPPGIEGYAPAPGDDDLVVLNARRSVLEWVLRRAAERDDAIDLRFGTGVTGVAVHTTGVRRVTGVTTEGGPLDADVVIDAAGRRSPVRAWTGGAAPDRDAPCGISYLTRFYRLRGDEPTVLNRGYTHGASFDRYSCLVFPADNGAFSVTFGILPEDRPMRALLDPGTFQRAAGLIPCIAPWVDPEVAEATTDVALMSSLHNLLRRPATDAPLGLHTIGDAVCVTNPAHTRGTSLALVAAREVAEAVDRHRGDPVAQAEQMIGFVDDELAPWVEDSIGQDADRLVRWRPDEEPVAPDRRYGLTNGQAYLAAQRDGGAWRSFTRLQNGLVPPEDVLDDHALSATVASIRASGWTPPRHEAPDHDELIAQATRSTRSPAGSS